MDEGFEKAKQLIEKYFPIPRNYERKAVLPHSLRVGEYLQKKKYPRGIILAGILHDALEFSEISQQMIQDEFGENVLEIVKACTKDRAIIDPDERINELAKRSSEAGNEALIVRTADVIDSFEYYTKTNNQPELEYCRKNAEAILKYKPKDINDQLFEELRSLLRITCPPPTEGT
jgi:guanosine-3',5'-bis(diphosphate) 3'-pyrophosphohydrolase